MPRSQLPTPTHARAVLASRTARYGADHPETAAARRAYEAERLEAHIRQVVDAAPALTPEVRNRLAALLAAPATAVPAATDTTVAGAA